MMGLRGESMNPMTFGNMIHPKKLVDIIKFCNNKFFKSGDALSTGAIIQYANQYEYRGSSWV